MTRFDTLGDTLAAAAVKWGDRTFITFEGGRRYTYGEVDVLASRVARGLIAAGVAPRDLVPLMAPNRPETLIVWFALARCGAVMAPLNVHLKGDLLSYMFEDTEGRVAVVYEDYLEDVLALEASLLEQVFLIRRDPATPATAAGLRGWGFVRDLGALVEASDDCVDFPTVRFNDPALIIYTSGTTGRPKGVLFSHNYARYVGAIYAEDIGYRSDDVLFVCVPLYHTLALNPGAMAALHSGASIALYERFSVSRFWEQVRASGATAVLGSGNMGELMMSPAPTAQDWENRLRIAHVIPAPPEGFQERFGVETIVSQLYGSTEVVPTKFLIGDEEVAGSCGRLRDDFDGIIANKFDEELPRGEVGELLVRPRHPYIMLSCYHNKPQATAEAFANLWFHTGDLLTQDAHGYLYFVGRKKEAIRRRGEMISAQEVERVITQFDGIAECAAVGVRIGEGGEEEIKVVVVVEDSAQIDFGALCEFAMDGLAYFMVPRYFEQRDELPRTASHRIRKAMLSEEGVSKATWDRESHGYMAKRER